MPIIVGPTIMKMEFLETKMDIATERIVDEAAAIVERFGREFAPRGVPGNSTAPSGELGASFVTSGPSGGEGVWTALVGPTTVYARQRELGGPILPKVAAHLSFVIFGRRIYATRVFQVGSHYLQEAEDMSTPEIFAKAVEIVAAIK